MQWLVFPSGTMLPALDGKQSHLGRECRKPVAAMVLLCASINGDTRFGSTHNARLCFGGHFQRCQGSRRRRDHAPDTHGPLPVSRPTGIWNRSMEFSSRVFLKQEYRHDANIHHRLWKISVCGGGNLWKRGRTATPSNTPGNDQRLCRCPGDRRHGCSPRARHARQQR